VDLIQNCEVTGIDVQGGKVVGVQTTRGAIRAKKVGIVVAGRSPGCRHGRDAAADRKSTSCRPS
jgi:glycine/D-amino acid oxidase-like deaminating enzyme